MPSPVTIDGVPCTLEALADGSIRVTHGSQQVTPLHGLGTGGEVSYIVHPAQRYQHEHLSSLLPSDQRPEGWPPPAAGENRPWWSYAAAPRDKPRGKDDGE